MRRWLLIDTGGDNIESLGRVTIATFASWDSDEPADGDLQTAALCLAAQREDTAKLEALLVPLDAAKTLSFVIEPQATLVATGGV